MQDRPLSASADHGARWLSLIPLAIIFSACLMVLGFLLPAAHDSLTESYEPTKTLRFIYTHGQAVNKWGPMPAFVFAPAYAALLTVYKFTGKLNQISSHYPFGLADPLRDLGLMILSARVTTLLIALAGIYYLTRTLQRGLSTITGPVLAVLLSLSTSLVFLEPLADTKPDGLMVAFLIFALANYAAIVLIGFTRARAIGLAFFYTASLSCKELTAVTLILPYLGLITLCAVQMRRTPIEGNRNSRLLAVSCLSVVGFYLLINVVYAPISWWGRMVYVFGPLKDPSIWAASGQTPATYLLQSVWAVAGSLGWAGALLLLVTIGASIAYPSWRLALLWLPFLSHLIFTVVTAGYMPAYFMLPLAPALCLPSAYVLCTMLDGWKLGKWRLATLTAALSICCTWIALCATGLFRYTHVDSLIQTALDGRLSPGTTVNIVDLFGEHVGFVPASLHATAIDPRPLFEIMSSSPGDRPDYLLISSDQQEWAQEIKARPARAAMLSHQIGFDYSAFTGFDSLGYSLDSVIQPKLPPWCSRYVVADSKGYLTNSLLIYRLRADQHGKDVVADTTNAGKH